MSSNALHPSLVARRRAEDLRIERELGIDDDGEAGSADDQDEPGPGFREWFREASQESSEPESLKDRMQDWLTEEHGAYWSMKKAAIYRAAIDQWLSRKLIELRRAMRTEAEEARSDARLRQAEKGVLPAAVGARLTALWMFPLHGGMPLRDATYEDLEQSIRKYRHDIGVYARRADFLEAVQKKLPDRGTTVGRALSDTDLDALARTTGVR